MGLFESDLSPLKLFFFLFFFSRSTPATADALRNKFIAQEDSTELHINTQQNFITYFEKFQIRCNKFLILET